MKRIVLVMLMSLGFASTVEAGRGSRGGGGSSTRIRSAPSGTGSSSSSHSVRGYTKRSGTYVAPHRQTNADHTQRNNYSTKGNINSSTGKRGTRNATH